MKQRYLSIALAAAGISAAFSAGVRAEMTPEVVAVIPHPGFLENLTEMPDGAIYITAAFDRIIWKVSADRKVEKFAAYPDLGDILGIAPRDDGFVVAAFQRSFIQPSGVDFSDVGSEILLIDKTGKITATIPGAKGAVFNGLIADGHGQYLIADSQMPVIWRFDPATKKISQWLKDPALTVPSPKDIGGDGLKVSGDTVFISNKAGHAIYRVARSADGAPKGALTLVADGLAAPDDFAVTKDKTVYLPPVEKAKPTDHTPFLKIAPDGKVTTMLADAPYGASAIISRDGKWLYWQTGVNGGYQGQQQELLRVPLQ